MHLITWNTFQAPTMAGRLRRRHSCLAALSRWADEGVDVVALQETNSFVAGPVMGVVFACLTKSSWIPPDWVVQVLDYLAILEGLLLPWVVIDNRSWIVAHARKHTPWVHVAESTPPPTRHVDCGLLLLSRFPLSNVTAFTLPRDVPHAPGVLGATVSLLGSPTSCRVITCHLLPSVPNTTVPYRVTNLLNALFGRNVEHLRTQHAEILREHVSSAKATGTPVVVLGDLNIEEHGEEWARLGHGEAFGCRNLTLRSGPPHHSQSTVCEQKFPKGSTGAGQIDFVLLDSASFPGAAPHSTCTREDELFDSDHYAVRAHIVLRTTGNVVP